MAKEEELLEFLGIILEVLEGGNFRVKLENGDEITANISGKMRQGRIPISPGDRVIVEMFPHDLNAGSIVFRKIQV